MKTIKNNKRTIAGATITVITWALILLTSTGFAQAQHTGTKRTELQRRDLSIPGREAVQVRIDFEPGAVAPKHTHPGEEIIYVLEGLLEYRVGDKPPKTLKAGDVLFIPAGAIHSAKNVGSVRGSELATYVVEKRKPLVTLVN